MRKGRGRPPKDETEKRKMRAFKLPPSLLDEVDEHIPPGERTQIVEDALRREVRRRQRLGKPEDGG